MIKVFFVRHAQSDNSWEDDKSRPLTIQGQQDKQIVLQFLKDKAIDNFYCSPYVRSINTIADSADYFKKEIILDARLRERENGPSGYNLIMTERRWADTSWHEEGGEPIAAVQDRNIAALNDILAASKKEHQDTTIVIGTHGTALSTILNYYDSSYDCDAFFRIVNWMPYIIELNFDGETLVKKVEHTYIEKSFWDPLKSKPRLKLVFPTIEHKDSALAYRQEHFDRGESQISGDGGLDQAENYELWIAKISKDLKRDSDRFVPKTTYFAFLGNKLIGTIQIRHKLNDFLLKFGGHISYGVVPSERRKSYATEMLHLALKECKALDIKKALIICNKNNTASAGTILKNGGALENEVTDDKGMIFQRYWIEIK